MWKREKSTVILCVCFLTYLVWMGAQHWLHQKLNEDECLCINMHRINFRSSTKIIARENRKRREEKNNARRKEKNQWSFCKRIKIEDKLLCQWIYIRKTMLINRNPKKKNQEQHTVQQKNTIAKGVIPIWRQKVCFISRWNICDACDIHGAIRCYKAL